MIVANPGQLDELIASGTFEKFTEALPRYVKKKEPLCKAKELMETSALSIGPVPIFAALWKKLGLPEAIAWAIQRETSTCGPAPVIFRMVLGPLLDPASKHSTHRWAETICRDDETVVELLQYYRSLGILARSIKRIEEHPCIRERDLFTRAPDLLFSDTTTTYFTGAGPTAQMIAHGFSKDNLPEKNQVLAGVVMTREGMPLAYHVIPGHPPDAEAFHRVIEEPARRCGLRRVILGGDCGMSNARAINKIEELQLPYIAGVRMLSVWDVREIVLENKNPFETVAGNLQVKKVELGGKQYVVCKNEEEAKQTKVVRESVVADLTEELSGGTKELIGNSAYRRYVTVEKDAICLDQEKITT